MQFAAQLWRPRRLSASGWYIPDYEPEFRTYERIMDVDLTNPDKTANLLRSQIVKSGDRLEADSEQNREKPIIVNFPDGFVVDGITFSTLLSALRNRYYSIPESRDKSPLRYFDGLAKLSATRLTIVETALNSDRLDNQTGHLSRPTFCLSGSSFPEIVAENSVFGNVCLNSTDFAKAKLLGSTFGVGLMHASFREAELMNARFEYSFLVGADFEQANLRGVIFQRPDLDNTNFEMAKLNGALFIYPKNLGSKTANYIKSRGGRIIT